MPSPADRRSGEIDMVALMVAQQGLIAEANHNTESRKALERRMERVEDLLSGEDGMFTKLALMQRQHAEQQAILSTLSTRAWQLVLAVICEALMVMGLYAWQGLQHRQEAPPMPAPSRQAPSVAPRMDMRQ